MSDMCIDDGDKVNVADRRMDCTVTKSNVSNMCIDDGDKVNVASRMMDCRCQQPISSEQSSNSKQGGECAIASNALNLKNHYDPNHLPEPLRMLCSYGTPKRSHCLHLQQHLCS